MPLTILDYPAAPECGGTQWLVANQDELATLVGTVLVGRAKHVASVLKGTQHNSVNTSVAQRNALRAQLHPASEAMQWHRDGLLFEIICWITARMSADANDVISDPHLSSTQQGADTIVVRFDAASRTLSLATIYEQKCTANARPQFRDNVMPSFKEWMSGKRDNHLTSIATGLLSSFDLTDDERTAVFDRLVQDRPLAFRAALTVTPTPFATEQCVAVFKDYGTLTPAIENRLGDTFPLPNIRQWFSVFAQDVWAKIEEQDV